MGFALPITSNMDGGLANRNWLTIIGPSPGGFSVSVDSKGKSFIVSGLERTVTGGLGSVDSKGVADDIMGRGIVSDTSEGATRGRRMTGQNGRGRFTNHYSIPVISVNDYI